MSVESLATLDDNNIADFDDDLCAELEEEYRADVAPFTDNDVNEFLERKRSANLRTLDEFLKSNIDFLAEGDNVSIVNIAAKQKKYNLPEDALENFFDLLEKCRLDHVDLHYMERQQWAQKTPDQLHSKSGIMIDFDRWQRSKFPQISEGHFNKLSTIISRLLLENLDLTPHIKNDTIQFHIFFIRKPGVVYDAKKTISELKGLYKDGFHILIPEIQVLKCFKRFLLDELRPRLTKIFSDIDHIVNAEEMLDACCASNPVFFLGSSKIGKPVYQLVHAVRMTIDTDDGSINSTQLDVSELQKGYTKPTKDSEAIALNLVYELSLGFYLDSLMGLPTWLVKRQYDYKIHLETRIQNLAEKTNGDVLPRDETQESENSVNILANCDAEAALLRSFLNILDISYATEYEKWFKVICAIAHTSPSYKPLAIAFSHRKPDSWNPAEFERVWNEAVNGRLTQKNPVTKASIAYWAEHSNKAKYDEIRSQSYKQLLNAFIYMYDGLLEHGHVARVMHSMIGNKFIVDTGNKNSKENYIWYEFIMPGQAMTKGEIYKYRRECDPDNIYLFISDHMPKVFQVALDTIKSKRDQMKPQTEEEGKQLGQFWTSLEKNVKKSSRVLNNAIFQNNIVRLAQFRFRQRGFAQQLDAYEDIMGVGNGIIKLGPQIRLITGFHEYKISKFTETDYIPYHPDRPEIKVLMAAIRDIFPEPDVSEFMLMYAATGLDRREAACIILFLTGGGQNGKSFFLKMINNTIGNQYCSTLKPSLLTSPTEAGDRANSAHMQLKGINIGYFDEFNKAETINAARLKSIVSPGWQTGRDLHKTQEVFKITANLIAASNYQFIIECTDHGTWRRIKYYKNKVKFCANPNPENPYEKKENRDFTYKYADDPAYKQAFLSILTHYYEILHIKYSGDLKNVPCPTIERETEQYRNSQDAVNKFITEFIVKSPANSDIPLADLASRYAAWYAVYARGNISLQEVTSMLENSRIAGSIVCRVDGQFLLGHRIRSSSTDPLADGEEYLAPIFDKLGAVINENPRAISSPEALPERLRADALARDEPIPAPAAPIDTLSDDKDYLDDMAKNSNLVYQTNNISDEDLNIDDILANVGMTDLEL